MRPSKDHVTLSATHWKQQCPRATHRMPVFLSLASYAIGVHACACRTCCASGSAHHVQSASRTWAWAETETNPRRVA